jgi:hypothetical protein
VRFQKFHLDSGLLGVKEPRLTVGFGIFKRKTLKAFAQEIVM